MTRQLFLATPRLADSPFVQELFKYMYSYLMGRKPFTADERAFGTQLGRVIAERRRESEMSGQALAEGARLSVDGLRKLEAGRTCDPGIQTVLRLAQKLEVTLDELVEQVAERRSR